jgi:hypothetical protein
MRRTTPWCLVLEGRLQRLDDLLGARLAGRLDDAVQLHQRRMLLALAQLLGGIAPVAQYHDQEGQVNEAEQLEEDAPAAAALLFGERLQRQLLDDTLRSQTGSFSGVSDMRCVLYFRYIPPSCSTTSSGSSRAPRHGPAMHSPVSGRYGRAMRRAYQV